MEQPTGRTCSACGETKPLTEYRPNKGACKPCLAAYGKQWRAANPDKVKAAAIRTLANRVRGPQLYSADYYARNAEHVRAKNRRYRMARLARTPDEVRADQIRLRPGDVKLCPSCANVLPLSDFITTLHTADGLSARCRGCHTLNGRLARAALGWWESNGMDPKVCTYCYAELNYNGSNSNAPTMHVDHIIPQSRGGSNEPENLAPACPSCNRSKCAKPLARWLTEARDAHTTRR